MADRLRELAREAALKLHMENVGGGKDLNGHVWKLLHDQGFEFCPHPDCILISRALAGTADPVASPTPRGLVIDRDAMLRQELRVYLDTLHIDGDNIGEIRRSLFVPWDSAWNGWVRDETAEREGRRPLASPVSEAHSTPRQISELRSEVGRVLRQLALTIHRADALPPADYSEKPTAADWRGRAEWLAAVLTKTMARLKDEHLAHLRAAARVAPVSEAGEAPTPTEKK